MRALGFWRLRRYILASFVAGTFGTEGEATSGVFVNLCIQSSRAGERGAAVAFLPYDLSLENANFRLRPKEGWKQRIRERRRVKNLRIRGRASLFCLQKLSGSCYSWFVSVAVWDPMKIASKIRILTLALALGASMAVGLVAYWGYGESILGLQEEVLEQRVESDISRLKTAFQEVSRDIRLLEGLPKVREIAARNSEEDKRDLAEVFSQLLLAKPNYLQARLIGAADNGRELVRVDRTESGIVRRTENELQINGHRDYFQGVKSKARGEVYYSEIDLNSEKGETELPRAPVLRVAMPVYDSLDTFWGIVIVNVDFSRFLEEFLSSNNPRFDHYLCNSNGDYLVHPQKERTFRFGLGEQFRVQEEFPDLGILFDSDDQGASSRVKRSVQSDRTLVHIRKAYPIEDGRVMFYGVAARFDDVITASYSIVVKAFVIVLAILAIAFLGAVLVSRLMTKPIERITLAARRLGEGSDEVDLPVGRRDEIGTLAVTFEAMRDSIKDQEGKILETNSRLMRANQDLEHFSHVASHELREPLTRIAGLISILEFEFAKDLGKEASGLMAKVKQEATDALRQITDFRIFAKLGGGVSLRERVDLGALARAVLEDFQAAIDSKGVKVTVDDMPTLEVYKNLVSVLYRNLIENALKYAEGEGVVLALTCERRVDGFVFGVRNTGSSIAPEDSERVFQVFVRLGKKIEGTGIGLSICKRIVERHLGEMWVESGNDFTNFKFTLEDRDR